MACVYYASLADGEVVEVDFLQSDGGTRSVKLLVDTGFTGRSSVVLGRDASDLMRAALPAVAAIGALQGMQERAWVTCRIPALSFQATVIAVMADLAPLACLPASAGWSD